MIFVKMVKVKLSKMRERKCATNALQIKKILYLCSALL